MSDRVIPSDPGLPQEAREATSQIEPPRMTRNKGWTGAAAAEALSDWLDRIAADGTAGFYGQQPWQIEAVLALLESRDQRVSQLEGQLAEANLRALSEHRFAQTYSVPVARDVFKNG